ncbi:unnamed protein product [Brachionus calyciflorus]|uniref:HTH CENPB-type domain-containing protein n=1 Tax=Brachionus calyciflorus TaxID=104777 RepID=A0A814J321_9BILA|nr:unnamed protein product [Brachionus calyciflorus]
MHLYPDNSTFEQKIVGLELSSIVYTVEEMLLEKAKQYGTMLSITNFNYSDRWLAKFKERHNIFQKTLHGESASVNQIEVAKGRSQLKAITFAYSLDDVFNFDETALFYKLQPNKTLSDNAENGCTLIEEKPDAVIKQKFVELEIEDLLAKLRNGHYNYIDSAKEYIDIDKDVPTGKSLSDLGIIELVQKTQEQDTETVDENIQISQENTKKVESKEAFDGLNAFSLFIEQSGLMNDQDIDYIAYFKNRFVDVKTASPQNNLR